MATKKLIEVALPLEKINEASAHEKSIRLGHPSVLHLWWARRPLATARAVLWSSLVDDPSEHPDLFPTEEDQKKERERLFNILEQLVLWENNNNSHLLTLAKNEIKKYNNGIIPEFLDPFAGGGAIPLEAQRLGMKSHAHDLNPVAVMINKGLIEIPSRFLFKAPVNPISRAQIGGEDRIQGIGALIKDIEYYGNWMNNELYSQIGELYPKVKLPGSETNKATVVSWIWARTAICPNPACGCQMPLVSNYILSTKASNAAYVMPLYNDKKLSFVVKQGKCPKGKESSKMGRSAIFKCPLCGEITTDSYIKSQAKDKKIGFKLMAISAEGAKGRIYLSSTIEQELAAEVIPPYDMPTGTMPTNPRWFSPPSFGMTEFEDLFSNRQKIAMTAMSDMIAKVQTKVTEDAINAGWKNDYISLEDGGSEALAYGQAISVYLAFAVDKCADRCNNLVAWQTGVQCPGHLFGRQAVPMVWDFAEANIFGPSGSFESMYKNVIAGLNATDYSGAPNGIAMQWNSQSDCGLRNVMISTDPPYYDNIGYADLSDFFYIWLRKSLKETYPNLFKTMLVPKSEELVATPYHFEGNSEKAKIFFENGMLETCRQIYKYANEEIPVTIYYAYKQSETEVNNSSEKVSSSGWETMLTSIIKAGFSITGTWPMRTERGNRSVAQGTNALASSIVLVCRKRPENAPQTTKKNLVNALRRELRPALKKLQESNIAPVDLAQSAIGPGMGVFSQYRRVLEADGTPMSVRSALQIINEEIDLYFNEQIGNMDTASRFCVDLYTQCAYNDIKYGEAEVLANAKGTSIPMMASHGVLYAKAGVVHLIERENLPEKVDTNENNIWMLTQQLTQAMAKGGVEACAHIVYDLFGSNGENAKDLAYRLYTIAERKGWANEAYAYNALVVAWPDIQSKAAELKAVQPEQMNLFDLGLLDKQ